ncbi:LPS export ABC transporter periplasmic protein LptC [Novosphingobium sp. 9]|uniref:LPS export ABC transporter periplasmic protein LptC n=1 Tax=Novosphingobium sp. 9 TaxID=2025349 RepID=UPI0021B5E9BF|nr:LPS export ABC transporter periplasmic protein LptC [Novosphingobium sp. 9]
MSVEATQIRNRRQHLARPGGARDRMIALLSRALPAGIGVMLAVLIVTPLAPRGEVSFLLDRNKVAVTNDRLAATNAGYRGKDDRGRPFLITADHALQTSATDSIVNLQGLGAELSLNDGPARINAPTGRYDYNVEKLQADGPVVFNGPDGYHMTTSKVDIDIKTKTAKGTGGVQGQVPTGTFSGDTMSADFENRTVILDGRARMTIVPGKMRIPK